MSLAASLEAEKVAGKPGPICQVCRLLDKLDDADAAALRTALADAAFNHEAISRALTAEGHDIQGQTVARHRKRGH